MLVDVYTVLSVLGSIDGELVWLPLKVFTHHTDCVIIEQSLSTYYPNLAFSCVEYRGA